MFTFYYKFTIKTNHGISMKKKKEKKKKDAQFYLKI